MSETTSERKAPRVDIIVVDPQKRLRALFMRAASRGAFAALFVAVAASAAARGFLPWYRTPQIDDAQPCNCRAPIRETLERALTEALVAEVSLAGLAFVVVTLIIFWVSRRDAAGKAPNGR